jgi:hypothetical protein
MNKPSRRAVVRTGVWAVPVVATAAAIPAFATGSGTPVTITGVAASCKLPGVVRGKSYAIVLSVHNSSQSDTITITEIDIAVTGSPVTTVAFCPSTFAVPPGDSNIVVYVTDGINSQQKAADITIFYTSPSDAGTQSFLFHVDSFQPFDDKNLCPKDHELPEGC